MAERRPLDRVLRVRSIQLDLSRAAEARARDQQASEADLAGRIARLAASVAPVIASGDGFSFAAAALYRERLHHSAVAADARVARAEQGVAEAIEARQSAHRDRTAVEKLLAQAEAEATLKAIRALEEAPPAGRRDRLDPR